jgi:hypothetical protein
MDEDFLSSSLRLHPEPVISGRMDEDFSSSSFRLHPEPVFPAKWMKIS